MNVDLDYSKIDIKWVLLHVGQSYHFRKCVRNARDGIRPATRHNIKMLTMRRTKMIRRIGDQQLNISQNTRVTKAPWISPTSLLKSFLPFTSLQLYL